MNPLTLRKVNNQLYRVVAEREEHVGNLKLIGALWKFKAIGHAPDGGVIPGGGPLTDRHNTTFVLPDETQLNATFSAEP